MQANETPTGLLERWRLKRGFNRLLVAFAAASFGFAGCADESESASTASTSGDETTVTVENDRPYDQLHAYNGRAGDMTRTEEVQTDACKQVQVYFATDSTNITNSAEMRLEDLTECLNDENIDGLYLIGHADPRGPLLYNQELALERAEAVRDELRSEGLDRDVRIFLSTADEYLADPTGYADDRRVEVRFFRDLPES